MFGGAVFADRSVYLSEEPTVAQKTEVNTEEKSARFVTNAVSHAQRLAACGMRVFLIGGELKSSTEAVIGTMAVAALEDYHFSKGFFGVNGVSETAGFTTPDASEALVKKKAMEQCSKAYILCDHAKFNTVSAITFASLSDGIILTDERPEEFRDASNIILCE